MPEHTESAVEQGAYDAKYYASHCGPIAYDRSIGHWLDFFGKIADELIRICQPKRVFDAGCAHGFLVESLWDRGVETWGRDISDFAISQVRADLRQYCSVGSLTEPISGKFDLATCIEVLEHMSEEDGAKAIANMAAVTDRIAFSSSPTDLTEPTHVNVKPAIYWMRLFAAHGFAPAICATLPSITTYAVMFVRADVVPREDELIACAELVRVRLQLAEQTQSIHHLGEQISNRDGAIATQTAEIARLAQQESLASALTEEVAELTAKLAENDNAASLHTEEITTLRQMMQDREQQLLGAQIALDDARAAASSHQAAYQAILASTTWRASGVARSMFNRLSPATRHRLRQGLKKLWRAALWAYPKLTRHARPAPASLGQYNVSLAGQHIAPAGPVETAADQKSTTHPIDFDSAWYLSENPDVAGAGIDPLTHYLTNGRFEGRYPNSREAAKSRFLSLRDLCDPLNNEFGFVASDDAFLVSVLTPTYNTDPRYLRELFQTLLNQQYPNWEWVVVDDGSSKPSTLATLRELASLDSRVHLIASPTNVGISAATNLALAAAKGTHAALVDHDDLLSRDVLRHLHDEWIAHPATDLFYTDECKLMPSGELDQFWPKPDWSPAYLENTMCIGHLSMYEIGFLRAIGFRSEFDGTQDYDVALRASLNGARVRHIPVFGYLWRIIPGSSAANLNEKHYAIDRQRRAVLDYAKQKNPEATVTPGWGGGYWRIHYPLPSPAPLLSYVIPAGGGSRMVRGEKIDLVINCIKSFEAKKFYPNREYIVVHNRDLSDRQLAELNAIQGVILVSHTAASFNFSETVNIGVRLAHGEFVCLLNDDVEAITDRGGVELVSYLAQNPTVGAIGPLCLREDDKIQQNGVVLLGAVGPAHAGDGRPRTFGGHQFMLRCRRESFVIGAAMLIVKKTVYNAVGGFSEDLPMNYNDVDFGLKLRDHGLTNVVDPTIEVYHYESATKTGTSVVEQERFFVKHRGVSDPYFSKWFDQTDPNFRLLLERPRARLSGFGPWLDRHIARRAAELIPQGQFKLSVCVSVYNQSKRLLEEMYKSVSMQTYANKELVIVDNGSSNPETLNWLDYARLESFATIVRLEKNIGIVGANQTLLDTMTGDFFVAMDADDFISVDALQMMAYAIEQNPGKMVFYSDEYKSDLNSTRFAPFFKPDFDPVLLMNCCYPAHLMAISRDFLKQVGAYSDAKANWSHDYDTITRGMTAGQEPVHVRELLYAWRINPGSTASAETGTKPGTVASQRFALDRLLRDRGLETVLELQPNTLETSSGMWRLSATQPVPNVKILDAADVWNSAGHGVQDVFDAANAPGTDWVAILLEPKTKRGLLELSAIGLFDQRIVAVCGLLTDKDSQTLRWSGGLFLPGGGILDPYAGKRFSEGGFHAALWCQRCIDVAAPVNVLIRAKAVHRAAAHLKGDATADDLMVVLGLNAHERGDFIAVTPHLRVVLPDASIVLPLDRSGRLGGQSSLKAGSRWYDGRLDADEPYSIKL